MTGLIGTTGVDLAVDVAAVTSFAAVVAVHASPVGAECFATGPGLGSGLVQAALGNTTLVLTLLDQALADGAGALAQEARKTGEAWVATDEGLSVRPV